MTTVLPTDDLIHEVAREAVRGLSSSLDDEKPDWFDERLREVLPALHRHTMPEWMTAAQRQAGWKLLAGVVAWARYTYDVRELRFAFAPLGNIAVLVVDAGDDGDLYMELSTDGWFAEKPGER